MYVHIAHVSLLQLRSFEDFQLLKAVTNRKVEPHQAVSVGCSEHSAGTNARVAFSANALSQAQLFYVASASGTCFAVTSFKAFSTDAADSEVSRVRPILQPRQHMYASHARPVILLMLFALMRRCRSCLRERNSVNPIFPIRTTARAALMELRCSWIYLTRTWASKAL